MRVTFLGQAGLLIETRAGSILCDPWFSPAYFGSWLPFPANDGIDPTTLQNPTYLYISHLHHDHFDPAWLADHVDRSATVILPDYPIGDLRRELHRLGFRRFVALGGWEIQRRCPHMKADLTRFATVDDGVLTCQLHGWQFDLAGGTCLTSADHPIDARRMTKDEIAALAATAEVADAAVEVAGAANGAAATD